VTGPGEDSCHEQAEQELADVGEGDPPVRCGAEHPEVGLNELVQEPHPRKTQAGIRIRKRTRT
jgi:hypothetical protein